MITLLTGLPGNGKTLFLLKTIKDKAEKENREVYYSGINIVDKVALPWTEFKAEEWPDLPSGAIILIDEAQFTFPKKPNGAVLPAWYEQLAVHRHKGFDIFVATQHPTLLDNFVRRLVGQHYHAVRKFGLERSTIYEWGVCNPAPEMLSSQKSAIVLKWAFPKEVYAWYKSAEVHTVKKRIPAKLVLAVLLVVAIVAGVSYRLTHITGKKPQIEGVQPAPVSTPPGVAQVGAAGGAAGAASKDKPFDPVADAKQFIVMNTPRIEGLPQTAPKYDELTRPVRVPVPAACVQIGSVRDSKDGSGIRCKCFTQQGTPMDVTLSMCLGFARNGFFQDFDPDKDRAAVARSESGKQALSERPDSRPEHRYVEDGPAVAVMEEVQMARVSGAPGRSPDRFADIPNSIGGRGKALPPVTAQ